MVIVMLALFGCCHELQTIQEWISRSWIFKFASLDCLILSVNIWQLIFFFSYILNIHTSYFRSRNSFWYLLLFKCRELLHFPASFLIRQSILSTSSVINLLWINSVLPSLWFLPVDDTFLPWPYFHHFFERSFLNSLFNNPQ